MNVCAAGAVKTGVETGAGKEVVAGSRTGATAGARTADAEASEDCPVVGHPDTVGFTVQKAVKLSRSLHDKQTAVCASQQAELAVGAIVKGVVGN